MPLDHRSDQATADVVARSLQEQGFAVVEGILSPEEVDLLQQVRVKRGSGGRGGRGGPRPRCWPPPLTGHRLPLVSSPPASLWLQDCETLCELAQAQCGGRGTWGADARASCIYEPLPPSAGGCDPGARTSRTAFLAARGARPLRPEAGAILFESRLAALVSELLGPGAVLYNEQFIAKQPRSLASAFAWHRDSDWCRAPEQATAAYSPYLSAWCALDDATEHNGCLHLQPGSHSAEGWRDMGQRGRHPPPELAGRGSQAAVAVPVAAGSAVLMLDSVLHCSGPNRSQHSRRAWMPQLSVRPILQLDTGQPLALAVPLRV